MESKPSTFFDKTTECELESLTVTLNDLDIVIDGADALYTAEKLAVEYLGEGVVVAGFKPLDKGCELYFIKESDNEDEVQKMTIKKD